MKDRIYLNNKVVVSDPCYRIGTWCQGVLENVKEGEYITSYTRMNVDKAKVETIQVINSEYENAKLDFAKEDFEVGVDSGMAGIFDYEYYERYHSEGENSNLNSRWYDKVGSITGGMFNNPEYIPLTETDEYKDIMNDYRSKLNELKIQYSDIDVEKEYEDVNSQYTDLEKPVDIDKATKSIFDLSGLTDVLEKLKNALDSDYAPIEKTEAEKALDKLKIKTENLLFKAWSNYKNTNIGQERIWLDIASCVDNQGFVSSSGFGDGGYTCYTAKNEAGQIVAIKVDFNYYDYGNDDL